jgi:hypothetical protein
MAEMKEYNIEKKDQDLKRADSKKNTRDSAVAAGIRAELFGGRKMSERTLESNIKVRKKLPIAIDIIAGILMLVLVCAIIIGSYILFRYYSNDYDGVNVQYKVSFDVTGDLDTYRSLKDGELFMDVTGNSVYFGKIVAVEISEDENGTEGGQVTLTVKSNVKYRKDEGYSIGDNRLGVGSKYTGLRCGEKTLPSVLVTGLALEGK